jgi:hypothetical protein
VPKSINLIAPSGGEAWDVGTTHSIVWVSTGGIAAVDIAVSRNGGALWTNIVLGTTNDGNFSWVVVAPESNNCLVRITETGGAVSAVSGSIFAIGPATVNLYALDPHYRYINMSGTPVGVTDPIGIPVMFESGQSSRMIWYNNFVEVNRLTKQWVG